MGPTWVPQFFYYFVCETDMWVPLVLLFFRIKLPRQCHIRSRPSQISHIGATSAKTAIKTAEGPNLVLIVEGPVVSGFAVEGRKSDSLTS